MRVREETTSIHITLSRPGYNEGKPLLSGLNADDLKEIDSAYQELSQKGRVLPQLKSKNGYKILKLSVKNVTVEAED